MRRNLLMLIGFILILVGCASMITEYHTMDYNYTPKLKKIEAIEVYFGGKQPDRVYTVIGIIEVIPDPDYWGWIFRDPKLEDYISAMKKEAVRIGADAIIDVNPPLFIDFSTETREVSPGEYREKEEYESLKGTAIIFQSRP